MIRAAILRWAKNRAPDFVIGGQEAPYLRRHWLLPRNRFFNVYVHEFLRSDDDRALHDHPWLFNASWLIDGQYVEHTPAGQFARRAGDWKFRWGAAAHRVELLVELEYEPDWTVIARPLPCWTVFITGPRVREWGFLCPKGWIPWQQFTDSRDSGAIGKGCAE
jgi:hypothetical protein